MDPGPPDIKATSVPLASHPDASRSPINVRRVRRDDDWSGSAEDSQKPSGDTKEERSFSTEDGFMQKPRAYHAGVATPRDSDTSLDAIYLRGQTTENGKGGLRRESGGHHAGMFTSEKPQEPWDAGPFTERSFFDKEGRHDQGSSGRQTGVAAPKESKPARLELHVRFWNLTYTVPSQQRARSSLSRWCGGRSAFLRSHPPPVLAAPKTPWHTAGKQILCGLTGHFVPGELVAILGPSGAGKSTLLSILGGRLKNGVGGRIEFNGEPMTSRMKKVTGYVTQQEYFFSSLTAEETLRYTARLRLGKSVTWEQKKARVDEVIAAMKLGKCRHVRVGSAHSRGMSGGELKRLNIANELLLNPAFFLLDEPTSGLDASTSADLLDLLKEMTQANGCTTVCTIHQPGSEVFMRFDRVMFLRDGHFVYQGSPSRISAYFSSLNFRCPEGWNVADYVMQVVSATSVENRSGEKQLAGAPRFTGEGSPIGQAEFAEGDRPATEETDALTISSFRDIFWRTLSQICSRSRAGTAGTLGHRCDAIQWNSAATAASSDDVLLDAYKRRLDENTFELRLSDSLPPTSHIESLCTQKDARKDTSSAFPFAHGEGLPEKTRQYGIGGRWKRAAAQALARGRGALLHRLREKELLESPGYCHQVSVLVCRGVAKELKGKSMLFDLLQAVLIGLLLGSLYYQKLAEYSENLLTERMGLLYFTVAYHSFGPAYAALNSFPPERNVIAKERSSEAYRLSCYLIAKTLIDWIIQVMAPTVWLALLYPLAGLPASIETFLAFWAQLVLLVATAQAVGQLVAGIVVDDLRLGGLMLSVLLIGSSISSGFYVNQHRLVPWISWLRWISFQNYSITNFIHITVGSRTLVCAKFSSFSSCPSSPITATMLIDRYTTALAPVWNVGITILLWLGLKILSYAAMKESLKLKV